MENYFPWEKFLPWDIMFTWRELLPEGLVKFHGKECFIVVTTGIRLFLKETKRFPWKLHYGNPIEIMGFLN